MEQSLFVPLGTVVRRMAVPFFLFAVVLCSLLGLSWLLLLPELTSVEVGGSVRSMQELTMYVSSLQDDIQTLEKKRSAFLLPVHHDLYERIKIVKKKRDRFEDLRRELHRTIRELVPQNPQSIYLSDIYYNAADHTARVRGEVSSVGPRSMTVLARFIEAVEQISFVIDVESSRFVRLEDAQGEFYTPFTLHILLDNV